MTIAALLSPIADRAASKAAAAGSPGSPGSLSSLGPVTARSSVPAARSTDASVDLAASSVSDISPLGQLLATLANFSAGDEASAVSRAAQRYVGDYNAAQDALNASAETLQATLLGTAQATTAIDFLQLQTALLLGNANGSAAALAAIGVTFQAGSFGQASIDLPTLQAALAADPGGTAALLTEAVQSTGHLASTLVNAGNATLSGNLSGNESDLALLGNGGSALALLVPTAANAVTGVAGALLTAAQGNTLLPKLPPDALSLAPDAAASPKRPTQIIAASRQVVPSVVTRPAATVAAAAPANTPTPMATLPVAAPTTLARTTASSNAGPAANTMAVANPASAADAVANAIASTTAAAVASYYLSNGALGSLIGERVPAGIRFEPYFGPDAPVQAVARIAAIKPV